MAVELRVYVGLAGSTQVSVWRDLPYSLVPQDSGELGLELRLYAVIVGNKVHPQGIWDVLLDSSMVCEGVVSLVLIVTAASLEQPILARHWGTARHWGSRHYTEFASYTERVYQHTAGLSGITWEGGYACFGGSPVCQQAMMIMQWQAGEERVRLTEEGLTDSSPARSRYPLRVSPCFLSSPLLANEHIFNSLSWGDVCRHQDAGGGFRLICAEARGAFAGVVDSIRAMSHAPDCAMRSYCVEAMRTPNYTTEFELARWQVTTALCKATEAETWKLSAKTFRSLGRAFADVEAKLETAKASAVAAKSSARRKCQATCMVPSRQACWEFVRGWVFLNQGVLCDIRQTVRANPIHNYFV